MVVILPQTVLKSNNTNVRMMGFRTRKHWIIVVLYTLHIFIALQAPVVAYVAGNKM